MTTRTMAKQMQHMLMVHGYTSIVRFKKDGIHLVFQLSGGTLMELAFDEDTTPDAAVAQAVHVLNKINGK